MKLKIVVNSIGYTQIELIQWIEGDCVYKEFLDSGKEGLNHVAIDIQDIVFNIKEFAKQNIDI